MKPSLKKKLIHLFNRTPTLLRQGIHFCYTKLIAPISLNEDDRRHEYILNIILCGFIALVTVFTLSLVITHINLGATDHQIPIGVFLIFLGLFVGLLILSRKGYFTAATYIFITLYFILASWNAFTFGVELPMVMVSYVIIIIISSILVSTRFGIIATSIIVLTLVTLGYFQVHGITHPDTSWRVLPILFSDPIQLSVSFLLITLLTWLSNREIESSLNRARNSEKSLLTERNNLEITVEERTREIKSLQAEKVAQLYRSAEFGRLSSGLFHDLMNPLNALISNVDLIKSNTNNLHDVEKYLEKSMAASRRMGEFLGSIRKQLGRHDLVERFSPAHEIIEVCEILTYRAREASVVLELKQLDDVTLTGNPLRFHQIAINLILNAIDSYKNTSRSSPVVEISLTQRDIVLVFTVTDQGSGISAHLLETIFDPFFTTKDPYHGTGLGLSTTRNSVVQDFNGTIEVTSEVNKGSTFTVTVPIS